MKSKKEQWTVTVCLRDGTVINPDDYTVPEGHVLYKVLEVIKENRRNIA